MTPNTAAFPDHFIDPREKDKAWILQFAKAAYSNWNESMPDGSIFLAKARRYKEIRSYAMGKQSIDKYKRELLPDDSPDDSWNKISWQPRQDGKLVRNIAVAKLQKAGYNLLATPITPTARDAQDKAYAEARARIMLREIIEQQAPEMTGSALLKKAPGEAEDLEELEMEAEFSPKFVRAKDVEESIDLVFYENDSLNLWDKAAEDVADFGVCIGKDSLNADNKVTMRYVYPGNFGCSATTDSNFGDVTWAFEITDIKLSTLARVFSEDEMRIIFSSVAGKNGNPHFLNHNNGYDRFKAQVLDLEFITWNARNVTSNLNKSGNLKVSKANPVKTGENYVNKTVEVVYRCKWVIGTDLIYDYGPAENQKRSSDASYMGKASLSYHIHAASFDDMKATGLTEDMISIIDDLCIATYKLRMFRNRLVPNGYEIDLDAIEEVALGKGGKNMQPREVIDMFFETGILVTRRGGTSSSNTQNYRAVNPISNSMADQLIAIVNDIQQSKQALRDISGLNELTDASTPNPRTLTTIANLANESTNNALYYLLNPRRKLVEGMGKSAIQLLQIAVKRGKYDGYNPAAGRWITVPESISDFDYDIMIEDRPTDDQKQLVIQMVQKDIEAGNLDASDVITILNTKNIKHAQILLAFRSKQNQKRRQREAMQQQQMNGQIQIQSNQAAEQAKLQSEIARHQMEMEKVTLTKSWDYLIKSLQVGQQDNAAKLRAETEIMKSGAGQEQQDLVPAK